MAESSTFLTARWHHLLMLNFELEAKILKPYVPAGTELDLWQGRCLVSMVGFLFLDTRVLGMAIPGHRNFEEVNLRFYVRRPMTDGPDRRGVVFIRELVPKWAIASVARWIYGEPYLALPMDHQLTEASTGLGLEPAGRLEYRWKFQDRWGTLGAVVDGPPQAAVEGSEAQFITEHYWGYTQRGKRTDEYEVRHVPWQVQPCSDPLFDTDVEGLYGPEFSACLAAPPCSAFIAVGSEISVHRGNHLR